MGKEGHMGMGLQTNQVLRTQGWLSALVRRVPLLACLTLAISTRATVPSSDLPGLDAPPNFAQLGNLQVDNLATITAINGSVGISVGGAASTANGLQPHSRAVTAPVPEPKLLILAGFAGLLVHSARRRVIPRNFSLRRKNQPKNLQSEKFN